MVNNTRCKSLNRKNSIDKGFQNSLIFMKVIHSRNLIDTNNASRPVTRRTREGEEVIELLQSWPVQ